jgi:hypothetical protein
MKYVRYPFFCLLIFSCTKVEKPTYKLTDDQLAKVLFDIHFADVMLPSLTIPQQDSVKQIYWNQMEEIYKMPESEIREEIKKLESDPEKFKVIIGQVKEMADSIQ